MTGIYNREMKEMLPRYGIEVVEIERKTAGGIPVSASFVRKCIASGDFETIKSMVPKPVYEYLKKREV